MIKRLIHPSFWVSLFVLGPLCAVIWRGGGLAAPQISDMHALQFTVWQAFLSALLSVLLATPLARALHRRRFWGRLLLLRLLGAPFILPVIVAILGLLAVFGQNGILNLAVKAFGLPSFGIYGLQGILLAHIFFNLPLATRALLERWSSLPSEELRLAQSLNLKGFTAFWIIEWPILRSTIPGVFALIFTICLTSFAVALTLGGGPRATTLELAIYQAFRYDFDLPRAASLAILQLSIAGLAAWIAAKSGMLGGPLRGLDRTPIKAKTSSISKSFDAAFIFFAATFLITPIALVLLRGIFALPTLEASIWQSAINSVTVALFSTTLCLCLALGFGAHKGGIVSILSIAVSPLILGIGLFIILRPLASPASLALGLTGVTNALMALPFALRIIYPARAEIDQSYGQLGRSLNMGPLAWLFWVVLPRLRPALGFAAGLTAALSMGDLGVITLFSDPNTSTLPMHLYRLMGSYRQEDAAGVATLLLLMSLMSFWVFERLGRK